MASLPAHSDRHRTLQAENRTRVAAVKQRIKLSDLIGAALRLRRRGSVYVGLCPFHVERTPSFTINDRASFFHCFGCGAHGDHFDWLREREGLSFSEALARLDPGTRSGRQFEPPQPRPAVDDAPERSIAWAQSLWAEGLPPFGTVVEVYLHARGIDVLLPEVLRFHASLQESQTGRRYPAMLAAIVDDDGKLIGVHRTYLRPDGEGKAPVEAAKKVAGRMAGGAIRLSPAGPVLGLAEGIETALSVMQATGIPCWAAVSLGNLAGPGVRSRCPVPHPFRPGVWLASAEPDLARPGLALPPVVRAVELYVDADNRDPATAECLVQRAARRFELQGRSVRIVRPPEGLDFNDVLIGKRCLPWPPG